MTDDTLRAALREPIARWIGRSGFVRPVGDPPNHDKAWRHMLTEADGLLNEPDVRAALAASAPDESESKKHSDTLRAALADALHKDLHGNDEACPWCRGLAERIAPAASAASAPDEVLHMPTVADIRAANPTMPVPPLRHDALTASAPDEEPT